MKYPCLLTKKINEISSAKYNPRKITDEAMGRLTKSLAEFGNIQPITWNVRTGNVVGGHQRLKVYKAMGKTEVDVWAVDLDEQKEKAANIALNKLSGEFDMPMLKDILEEIDTGDLDMEITGFGMDEIALMMEDAHPEVTEDEVPEVPVDAITKPGDLWILGEHRVLCGDSTSEADVSRLMNGEKADMVFTDPPYGIGFTDTKGNTIQNDDLSDEKLSSFNTLWQERANIASKKDCFLLAWQSPRKFHLLNYFGSWKFFRLITMYKSNRISFPHGAWINKTEPCCVFSKGHPKITKIEYMDDCYVYKHDKESHEDSNVGHPTPKPVKMVMSNIQACANKNDLILDLFLGSGSTLIATEKLGRKCYGMEISPNYCDVIVKRWENLTGKKATLAK
jgi:DNA modification methylase